MTRPSHQPTQHPKAPDPQGLSRRQVLASAAAVGVAAGVLPWLNGCTNAVSSDKNEHAETAAPGGGGDYPIRLDVNGHSYALTVDPRVSLLDAIRDDLGLTGTKKGCDHGQCGACTVLMDRRRINSCLVLAVAAHGKAITTIEGIGSADALDPIQSAFVEHDAFQCGYCTPGQICSAAGLINEGHARTDDDIREQMAGNLCRCGAYPNIRSAIKQAMKIQSPTQST